MSQGQLKFRVDYPESNVDSNLLGRDDFDRNAGKLSKHAQVGGPKRRAGGKHQMAACSACKKKRKKCDGNYPICSGCLNSGSECTVLDVTTGRTIPRNYIQTLEEEVNQLSQEVSKSKALIENQKTKISDLEQLKEISTFPVHNVASASCDGESSSNFNHMSEKTTCEKTDAQYQGIKNRDLEMEMGYITLGVGAESKFMGDSSAFSIAKAIAGSINYYQKERRAVNSVIIKNQSSSAEAQEFEQPFTKPSLRVASIYLNSYKVSVQCQYPFLDWEWVETCFDQVMNQNSENPEDIFFIYLIFAIGAQLSNNNHFSTLAYIKLYYNKAMESVSSIIEVNTIRTVQAYLIISAFSQKMPDGSSIWQSTGLAIRTAVSLGLHRQPYHIKGFNDLSEKEKRMLQLRYRIFWCAYGMERINGIVLGRPFGISDIDIDVSMPQEIPDTFVACHVFKLRRIQSNICSFVYKPVATMDSFEEIDTTRVQILLELNDWMSTFPAKANPISPFESSHWSQISYHNSILLLLRPVVLQVSKLKSESNARLLEWFKVFTQSASAICTNYKDLHAKGKLGYTWLAMHCVFVAGLSFLYCLWIDASVRVLEWKKKWLIYETISACSSVLYVLAERYPTASVFRDTYERISNAVLTKIENPEENLTSTISGNNQEISSASYNIGVLDERSIRIAQYLGFKTDMGISVDEAKFNAEDPLNSSQERESKIYKNGMGLKGLKEAREQRYSTEKNAESSMWEFLDNTGDKFLRDIYYDMENNFTPLNGL